MSKLILLFFVVFCFVQIALATRVERDTPKQTDEDTAAIEALFERASAMLKSSFVDENEQRTRDHTTKLGEALIEATKILEEKLKQQ